MAMIEQNISGVKLEKIRQNAKRKTKVMFTLPAVVFAVCLLFTLVDNRYSFLSLFTQEERSAGMIWDGLLRLLPGVMLGLCMAAASFGLYLAIVWQRAYNRFNDNYKNKYVLLKMREASGFSNLKYSALKGIPFAEIANANLLPGRAKDFYQSKDYFEGSYHEIHFHAASVETHEPSQSSVALFSGQVIVFSTFHEFKISETAVQVFSKKEQAKMKGLTFPVRIETENEAFNRRFCVFTEDAHNAFYILTPEVLEALVAFDQMVGSAIYLVFRGSQMYLGCAQMRSPFDALIDVPIEQQAKDIAKAADIIRKARDVLIHMEHPEHL